MGGRPLLRLISVLNPSPKNIQFPFAPGRPAPWHLRLRFSRQVAMHLASIQKAETPISTCAEKTSNASRALPVALS